MPIDNPSSPLRPLGHLDLEAFLAERSVSHRWRAEVHVQLIDAGMIRSFSQVYEWRLGDDGVSLLPATDYYRQLLCSPGAPPPGREQADPRLVGGPA